MSAATKGVESWPRAGQRILEPPKAGEVELFSKTQDEADDGFDIAVKTEPGRMPADFTRETATWVMHAWPAVVDLNTLFDTVVHGPPG